MRQANSSSGPGPEIGASAADRRRPRGIVVVGHGAEADLARRALRRLGLRSRQASMRDVIDRPPISEGVMIAGPIGAGEALDSRRALVAGDVAFDPPVLWSALAAAEAAAGQGQWRGGLSASRFRFAPAVREALAAVGEVRRFRAIVDAPPPAAAIDPDFWARTGGGVLSFLGADLMDLLSSVLDELSVAGFCDDARGGLAAEAHVSLEAAGGTEGEIELSWLRNRGAWLELTGSRGQARIDLADLLLGDRGREAAAAAEAARIGAWLSGSLTAGGAPEFALRCAQLRRPLAQPWEGGEDLAGGLLAGKRILVVGASGFIGARLTEALAAGGARVTAALRDSRRAARIARYSASVVGLDLSDAAQLERVVSGHQVVFSLAHDLDRSAAANFAAYGRLAEAASRAGVERFVQTSSIAVYDAWPRGDLDEHSARDAPAYEYKDVKRAIERDLERRAREGQFTAAIVQPTIVYGPFSKLWTDRFAGWLRRGPVVLPAGGRGLCNGVYVDDLVQALIRAAAGEIRQVDTFIVSGPAPFAWRELLDGYAAGLGGMVDYEPERSGAPAGAAQPPPRRGALASLAQAVVREVRRRVRDHVGPERIEALRDRLQRRAGGPYRPGDAEPDLFQAQGVCSIEKARAQLGYAPAFSPKDGLARTQAYLTWRYGDRRSR